MRRVGDLEIDLDPDFERRILRFQQAGWAVLGLIVLAALLGLFNTGLFSKAVVADPEVPLRLEYDHFLRYQAPQRLRIRVGPLAAPDRRVRLWISDDYLEGVQVRQIDPRPERTVWSEWSRSSMPACHSLGVEPLDR